MKDPSTTPASQQPATAPTKHALARRLAIALVGIVAIILAYLLLWPSPIDPLPFEPSPSAPLVGPLAPNDRLAAAEQIAVGQVEGPEDVEVDEHGRIVTGTADGRIVAVDPDGKITTLAATGGRPAGIATDPQGNLIVADAAKGLLKVDSSGQLTTLASGTAAEPLGFVDDVDVARDGTIYFSDASSKFGAGEFLYDMLEARPHGRLLTYDPATNKTATLLPDLYFANGVALSQQEDFVLVCETYRFRIMRYWLAGERAGQSEVFIDNLPGYPDNITSNRRGAFWLALFTVRNREADWLSPRPFLKSVLAKLPTPFWPKPERYAFVVKLDETGKILDSFQDPQGRGLYAITSAFERDGYLYLGSLYNNRIGKYKLP